MPRAGKGPITFVVVGSYNFPTDMLRYDACYPASSDDAIAISAACDTRNRPRERQITLKSHLGAEYGRPTEGRWESFGWKVKEVRQG